MKTWIFLLNIITFQGSSGCQSLFQPFQLPNFSPLSVLPDLMNDSPKMSSSGLLQTPEERVESVARIEKENHEFYQRAAGNIPESESCRDDYRLTVLAVSTAPYSPDTVIQNLIIQRQSLKLLEIFTGMRISRFGPYTEESINLDGFYAYKIVFEQVDDCAEAKEFTTKAVSYSKHIEKALFKCGCENIVISKLHK